MSEKTPSKGRYDSLPGLQSGTILSRKIEAGAHAAVPVAEKASIRGTFAAPKKGPVWVEVSGIVRTVKIQKDCSILDLQDEGRRLSATVHEDLSLFRNRCQDSNHSDDSIPQSRRSRRK
ncbi:MAG TPA: hypothetical protein VFA74_14455 [Terriglobales bacterium]|nr:hypothetical protein [Terriglobales bacterium]